MHFVALGSSVSFFGDWWVVLLGNLNWCQGLMVWVEDMADDRGSNGFGDYG